MELKVLKRQKRSRQLLKAHREPTETLQLPEQVRHEMLLSIQISVDFALRLSSRIRGNDRLAPLLLQLLHQRLCIIRSVPSIARIVKVAQQLSPQLHLMGLSFREGEPNWVSECADDGMDLGGATSARAPNSLASPLFLAPAAS